MKDQVVMSPANGQLCIAVPLYRLQHEENLGKIEGYSIQLTNSKPVAYAMDFDDLGIQLWNAEFVESSLEFLGDL